jgi:hypothetical protein
MQKPDQENALRSAFKAKLMTLPARAADAGTMITNSVLRGEVHRKLRLPSTSKIEHAGVIAAEQLNLVKQYQTNDYHFQEEFPDGEVDVQAGS